MQTECSEKKCSKPADNGKSKIWIIYCQAPMCDKFFHSVCIGYSKKTKAELNELYFLCTDCHNYTQHLSKLIQNNCEQIIDEKIETLKIESLNASIQTFLKSELEKNISKLAVELKTSIIPTNTDIVNTKTNKNDNMATLNEEVIQETSDPLTKEPEQKRNNIYLCSLVSSLNDEDVINLLKEHGIDVSNISVETPIGINFVNKKYVKIYFASALDEMNFKISFNNSILCKTIFIRDTAPKKHTNTNTNIQSRSTTKQNDQNNNFGNNNVKTFTLNHSSGVAVNNNYRYNPNHKGTSYAHLHTPQPSYPIGPNYHAQRNGIQNTFAHLHSKNAHNMHMSYNPRNPSFNSGIYRNKY